MYSKNADIALHYGKKLAVNIPEKYNWNLSDIENELSKVVGDKVDSINELTFE
jgi:hypothetical protein